MVLDNNQANKLIYQLDCAKFIEDIIAPSCNPPMQLKWFHREWIELFNKNRFVSLLAPRSHGKTQLVGAYIIWKIVTNPKIRILVLTINQQMADDIMSFIQRHLEGNEKIEESYGKQRGYSDWSRSTIRVLGAGNQKDPTLKVLGITASMIGGHHDMIILDDIMDSNNSRTEHRREEVIRQFENTIMPMLIPPKGKVLSIACLIGNSKVLMADGNWKNIKDINTNEFVWSYDIENKKLVKSKVSAVIPQGLSDVYKVGTKSNSIVATSNHPFLAIVGNTKVKWNIGWKRLDELKIGDWVVTSKTIKTNGKAKIDDSRYVDKDFMWLFGYLTGDGWVGKYVRTNGSISYHICVAQGIYDELNDRACNLIEKYFGRKPYLTKVRTYRLDCNEAGRILENLGLIAGMGAQNKTIPDWVFKISPEEKVEFIKGLIDSDGWQVYKDNYRVVSSSKELIDKLLLLSQTCGIRTGRPFYRNEFVKAPNSKYADWHESWSLSLTFSRKNIEYDSVYKKQDEKIARGLRIEKIKNIEKLPKQDEVWDLSVENTHNFISDGYIVHNTRWHEKDISAYLQSIPDYTSRTYKSIIKYPDEKNKIAEVLWPEVFPYEELIKIKERYGSLAFEMQYQNNIVSLADSPIRGEWIDKSLEDYKLPEPEYDVFMGVDFASKGEESDYFVIVIVAVKDAKIYVLDALRTKASLFKQFDLIKSFDSKWQPIRIGIEQAAQQKIIVDQLVESTTLPIIPIKSSIVNDRMSRVQRLSVLFETGRIFMNSENEAVRVLSDEARIFPHSSNDDLLDGLSFAVQASQYMDEDKHIQWDLIPDMVSSRKNGETVSSVRKSGYTFVKV